MLPSAGRAFLRETAVRPHASPDVGASSLKAVLLTGLLAWEVERMPVFLPPSQHLTWRRLDLSVGVVLVSSPFHSQLLLFVLLQLGRLQRSRRRLSALSETHPH